MMPESMLPPPPPAPDFRSPHSSSTPSWVAAAVALATSIGGIVTALQQGESSEDTQRAAYEALRRADEDKTRQLRELAEGQLELRTWVAELSARLEQRAANAEKALRKVKPKAPLPPPEPPPPAPPPPKAVITPTPLPAFEELAR